MISSARASIMLFNACNSTVRLPSSSRTTLKINSDTTYELRSEYLGRKDGVFEESGIYNIVGENIIELVTPSSGEKTFYKILDGSVALSDSLGTLNGSELAEHYILKRQ